MKKQLFLPFPGISSDINITQKLLAGLGKSTKRGIKKCYNCGVYNGTRRTMCKNKECAVVLKDYEEKSKIDLDAVKLLTGTEKQVYSVRVRDMGPDYRGFVQLPVLQTHSEDDANILSEVALCFVNSCQNSFDNSILKCHEEDQNDHNLFCIHIKSSIKSRSIASPMRFKNDTLNSLNISDSIKQKLFLTATEKEGYFVQRVSKSVMVVKCQVSPKHPLGYLHFTFTKSKGKDAYEKWMCSCEEYSALIRDKLNSLGNRCIHYYACVWALASDEKYCEEFNYFIQKETQSENLSLNAITSDRDEPPVPILKNTNNPTPFEKNPEKLVQGLKLNTKDLAKVKKTKKKEIIRKCQRIMPKILPIKIKILSDVSLACDDSISWNFLDWLSFATESINRTMQFENCGILNSLTFQIPENFYIGLMKRIPNGYNIVQNDLSITYHIMNILHLKTIFDTPQVKLKISKKFIHSDQGYIEYDENGENIIAYQSSFIFFLNVGESTVDESDNTNNSFIIEWILIPNSVTKVGELKLYYKYGRKST